MNARGWPVSPASLARLFWASALICAALLFSLQPAPAQWVQQGELFGAQGESVALSCGGSTAIVGGGAAWVFTFNGAVWNPQQKLVVNDAIGPFAGLGKSVALSADGNTAIVGGPGDNDQAGAAWVFTFNGTTWAELQKLHVSDAVGAAQLGTSVALSGNGKTAIVGGPGDNAQIGAAWVFTSNGTTWTELQKLVATDAIGSAGLGMSVALSGNGNTAIVGGPGDNDQAGAAWVFTFNGTTWAEQQKLVGTDAVGAWVYQGFSVALSADGNTAIFGGPGVGAAWVFGQLTCAQQCENESCSGACGESSECPPPPNERQCLTNIISCLKACGNQVRQCIANCRPVFLWRCP